jgi:hypothetical protein
LAFVERALSSLLTNGSSGSGGTIARSPLMHLAGAGRVNLVHYVTCLHRLARVMALPTHPGDQDNNDCNGDGPERNE